MMKINDNNKSLSHHLPQYFAESTSAGVIVYKLNSDKKYHQYGDVIHFGQIISRADAGEWDHLPSLCLRILSEWTETQKKPTPMDTLVFYRWMVSFLFVTEQAANHGKPLYVHSGVKMDISLGIERLAIANNIEGALIERFGEKNGVKNAISFYQQMISIDSNNTLHLSDFGRDTLVDLHNSFVQQVITNGLSSTLTKH